MEISDKQLKRYQRLRDRGVSAKEMASVFEKDNVKGILSFKLLRQLYGLSLKESKEVLVTYDGNYESLDDYQEQYILPMLDKALHLMELEDIFTFDYGDVESNQHGELTEHQSTRLQINDGIPIKSVKGYIKKPDQKQIHIDDISFTVTIEQNKIFQADIVYQIYFIVIKQANVIVSIMPYAE